MMTLEEMQALLKDSIPGKRYKHSVNVYETALKLAEAHGLPQGWQKSTDCLKKKLLCLPCCMTAVARWLARTALLNVKSWAYPLMR